mgnify:CR=1 FL=1
MEKEAKEILKGHALRQTNSRLDIASFFLKNKKAISHSDIESQLDGKYDRVTIYRTLKSFIDKGLIHQVLDDGQSTLYALCSDCSTQVHQHNHVHFKCLKCAETVCLEGVVIPKVQLPEGFEVADSNFLITGVCKDCA